MDYYSSVKLSDAEIQNQEYKKHLGGGAQHWENIFPILELAPIGKPA